MRLFVPLASPKVLPLERAKENPNFLLPFTCLFVPLQSKKMKKIVVITLFMLMGVLGTKAQQQTDGPFRAYLFNDEYKVFMRINLYEQDVVISWQEMFGPLPGFLAKEGNNYCWIITDAKIDGNKAELEITNDYGSEDLTATLTCVNDSVYTLRQNEGSPLKVPDKKSWKKLPSTMTFIKKK